MNTDARQQTAHHRGDERKSVPVDKRDFWDGRAKEFSEYAASTGYSEAFIRAMQPRKGWTILDMACGGGTIAIPLAKKVKSITAVDFSTRMLEIVDRRCHIGNIANIKTIQGRWEDDWDHLGIGVYDVVIASRALISDNIKDSIAKLNKAARKAVYISTAVGSGPFDKRLFESTGRKFAMGKDYIYYYTMLYKMGIIANVTFLPEKHRNEWDSHEAAFEDQRWMFRGITDEEETKVKKYLKKHLMEVNGRWRLPYPRECRWALMWWTKDREVKP